MPLFSSMLKTIGRETNSNFPHRRNILLRPCLLTLQLLLIPTIFTKSFTTIPALPTANAIKTTASSSLKMSSSSTIKDSPFGSWESPISSQSITVGSVGIGNLHLSSNEKHGSGDTIYWTEGRSTEGGRNVLCRYDPTSTSLEKSERNGIDVTPKTSNIRSRVHEYGGGAMTFASTTNYNDSKNKDDHDDIDDTLFFTEFSTQKLFRINLVNNNDETDPIAVPTTGENDDQYRYADGEYDKKRGLLFCIRENHGPDGKAEPKDVINEIVALDVVTGNVRVIVTGYDFTVAPKLSPDGTTLACIVWDHPNMPWDATKLLKVSLPPIIPESEIDEDGGSVLSPSSWWETHGKPTVVAGHDDDTSIIQPLFHPITGKLFYISDQSGYYNIYMDDDDDEQQQKQQQHCVLSMDVDFGGSSPGWALGQQGFSFLKDGRLVATFNRDGASVLVVANVMDWNPIAGTTSPIDTIEYTSKDGLPMQFGAVQGGTTTDTMNDLYFMGGSPSTPSSVYYWNLKSNGTPAKILACSSTLKFDDSVISVPKQVEFPTTLGTAFGYYYPPKNGDYKCTTESAPPLLVKAHGGPTGCTGTTFSAAIQYWTSRGFAILDVDYGGSTGYGRAYRRRLRNSWGIVDIDDVCNGAQYLVNEGLADANRLCIDGGSAGGYTTLGALAFRDVFKAGCSLYGIGDLTALARDTHKFESRYLEGLLGGKYPEDEKIFKDRSPIEHIDKFNCPILILQGDEDKVVPPNQAVMMHEAVKAKNIPSCLKIYEGEQHGFRKAENREDALDSELSFFGRVFGIDVPGAIALEIDNM